MRARSASEGGPSSLHSRRLNSPGRTRTCDSGVQSAVLYQLSYRAPYGASVFSNRSGRIRTRTERVLSSLPLTVGLRSAHRFPSGAHPRAPTPRRASAATNQSLPNGASAAEITRYQRENESLFASARETPAADAASGDASRPAAPVDTGPVHVGKVGTALATAIGRNDNTQALRPASGSTRVETLQTS
jgi:hypothetical protein